MLAAMVALVVVVIMQLAALTVLMVAQIAFTVAVQDREQLRVSLENLPAIYMRQVVAVFPMERQPGLTTQEMAAITEKLAVPESLLSASIRRRQHEIRIDRERHRDQRHCAE